jgi:4-hydroxy-tetrahydrodipicolinate synthase
MCGGRNIAGGRSKAMTSIDPKLRKALTGISGILVTPFDQEDKLLFLRNDGIGLDAIEQLCRIEGVAGVKWAAPTPLRLAEAIRRGDPDIVWVGGLVEIWAPPLCAVGARGFTSGLINVWPEHSVAIHAALEGGDYARANRLIGVMSRFEEIRAEEQNGTNVTAVKAALQLMGEDCRPTRPPSAWPLTENQSADLRALLTSWKLMPHLATAELKRATN